MSKVYNLTATLNTGRSSPDSSSDAWESYATWNEASSHLGDVGYDAWDYATNMLFDSSTLSTLRSKTITGITLELNVTKGTTGSFYIGYKLNSTASGNTNSTARARGNNAGTQGAGADTVATVDNPSFTSIEVGTRTLTLKNALPQYGLTSGATSSNFGRFRISSAILHVTTNEVTISYKKGASGSGTEYTDVAAPNRNLRGAIFTRTGYTQTGWATSDGGAKVYNLSAQYTGTADLTLYPYWTAVTYTVTYAPGSYSSGSNYTATKTYGVALTLRGATYTRANYSQDGWSVNSNGSTKDYNLSGSYTNNAATTLYPHWKADTYTISYNANGGSGAPAAQTKTYGVSLTLSSTAPTRTNYIFLGWATSATGAVAYQPGGSYTANAAVTLYAIWQAAKSTLSTITSSVNIGSSGTAGWNIVNSAYTYKLVITYGNAPAVTVNVAANTSSTSFTIPTTWYAYLPNVTSVTATATLTTYSGSTSLGSTTKTFTVAVASSVKPTISSFTHAPYSQNSTVNGWGVYVQGYSQVDLSVSAAAGTGASIVSIAFSGTGISQSGTATTARSSVLSNTGYLDYSVTVTDSRGRSVTSSLSGTGRPYFYEYSNPVVTAMTAFRSNSSGVEDAISGTYIRTSASFTFSSCGNKNSLSVKKIEYKLHTASSWTSGVATATSGTAYTIGGGNIAITSSYDVRCTVTDALSHTTTYVVLVPPIVGFAVGLNNDRARFGGPVEKAGLQVDWDAEFNGVVDVTPRRCYATLSSAGWYRVMDVAVANANASKFSVAIIVDINIGTEYYANSNGTHKISLHGVFNNVAFLGEESKSNNMFVSKVRYTYDSSGNGHIDIYYTGTSGNPVWCTFAVHMPYSYQHWFVSNNFTAVAASPSGETVMATYSFMENTDGSDAITIGSKASSIDSQDLRKKSGVAYGSYQVFASSFSTGSWNTIGTIPTGYRPSIELHIPAVNRGNDTVVHCRITTGGSIDIVSGSAISDNTRISVNFTYAL